jgi:hypothetical protein
MAGPAIIPIVSATDGPRVTVNDLINNPTVIPRRILEIAANQFVADSILRNTGANNSGVVEFFASTPLFANTGAAIRQEFGEYQLVTTSQGTPSVVATVDRGLGILVSDEMRNRNKMDLVNTQLMQVNNTLRRDWDAAFMALFLANPSVQTFAVATAWATSTTIRQDILRAEKLVSQATTGVQTNNFLNFNPDTLIITENSKYDILSSSAFNSGTAIFQGNLADQNLLYTGLMPQKLLNLDVLVVKSGSSLPDGNAIVLERGTVGFISDEEPLQATPLYRQQENRRWRSDVNRKSAMGLDQPKAALILTGV